MNKLILNIINKIKVHGYRRSMAEILSTFGNKLNDNNNLNVFGEGGHQNLACNVLSRYISFKNKHVLEIGGSLSCQSAKPFFDNGAASVVVTGLGHISKEQTYKDGSLTVMHADALELSKIFEPNSFDVVYGLSVIEHIPNPQLLLEELYKVLRPNGMALLQGNPIWSSPKGHHLWIGNYKSSPFKGKVTADYYFYPSEKRKSVNPLPDWSHLLLDSEEMASYLKLKGIPNIDIECIIEWVYRMNEINRLSMKKIAESYTTSPLIVLEANTVRFGVPHEIKRKLTVRYGEGIDFGCEGITYVLQKC
jgi:SAM-dependent methyltransferase